jgi:hypothetical protein
MKMEGLVQKLFKTGSGKRDGCKGQSLVEAALILPVILLLFSVIFTFGMYLYDMTIIAISANKGLDRASGLIYNSDFTEEEKNAKVEETIRNFAELAMFVTNEDGETDKIKIEIIYNEEDNYKEIIISVSTKFSCILPFMEDLMDEHLRIYSDSSYIYEEKKPEEQ